MIQRRRNSKVLGKQARISLVIPAKMKEALQQRAATKNVSMTLEVINCLREVLEKNS